MSFVRLLSLSLSIFSLLIGTTIAKNNQENKVHLLQKPYLTLKTDIKNCDYEVYLNDLLIIDNKENNYEIIINPWVHNRKNVLKFRLYQINEPISDAANCGVNLLASHYDDADTKYEIAKLHYSSRSDKTGKGTEGSTPSGRYSDSKTIDEHLQADSNGKIKISGVSIEKHTLELEDNLFFKNDQLYEVIVTMTIDATLPFPEWAFFSADDLPDSSQMNAKDYNTYRSNLYQIYSYIQKSLESKNIEDILPFFEFRHREIDQAFFKNTGVYQKRYKKTLTDIINDKDYALAVLNEKNLNVVTDSNHKLARLKRSKSEKPAIIIKSTLDGGGLMLIEIILSRKNGEWFISR